jgi:hypothetical protein
MSRSTASLPFATNAEQLTVERESLFLLCHRIYSPVVVGNDRHRAESISLRSWHSATANMVFASN